MAVLTTGTIAQQLNVDRDKVSYAVRKLAIEPVGLAGQVRIFPKSAPSAVKKFLNDKRKKKA